MDRRFGTAHAGMASASTAGAPQVCRPPADPVADSTGEFSPLGEPPTLRRRRGSELATGPPVDPGKRIAVSSPEDLENIVLYWLHQRIEHDYARIVRWAGSGDKGRDVAGYLDRQSGSAWDNYQCKRLATKLSPGVIWSELGKLVYWTFKGSFESPRRYVFVSPKGVSPKTRELLEDSEAVRKGLKKNWDKASSDLCEFAEIDNYLAVFDFPELDVVDGGQIVDDLNGTAIYSIFFGGGLSKPRPPVGAPPPAIGLHELGYVNALVDAYDDHSEDPVPSSDAAFGHSEYGPHLERSRANFYCAESLREFSKDVLVAPDSFEDLQQQVNDGIQPKLDEAFPSGYDRVLAVSSHATTVQLSDHPLQGELEPADRIGICHQLANDGRVKWRKP
jgi:hypothetical protein